MLASFGRCSRYDQHISESEMNFSLIGREFQGFAVVLLRILEGFLADINPSKIEIGSGIIWIGFDRLFKFGEGSSEISVQREKQSEIIVSVRIVGPNPERLTILGHRRRTLAALGQQSPEVIVGGLRIVVDGDGVTPESLGIVPRRNLLPRENAQADENQAGPEQREPGRAACSISFQQRQN